jgi:hypothetical protein
MTLNRFFTVVLFLVVTATVANAYTLVMRNGRRVEIPNEFVISGSMLTYQVGSGIQMTLQLSGIDIAKTERVNSEAPGSFLARGTAPLQVVAQPAQPQPRAQRSITNLDLEGYRRTRIESELAYEKRRKELDLPSVAQQRAEFAALEERTRHQLMNMRSADESAEEYWRSRASSLRSEEATTLAQINYVRQRLDEIASAQSSGVLPIVNSFGNGPFLNFPIQNGLGGTLLNTGLQTIIGFNNGHRNVGNRRFPFGNNHRFNRFRRNRGPFGDLFGGNVLALPYQPYDYSYERAELANQLDDLQMRNAALRVRWRELEDEARRAGAYPGWLRP